MMKNSHILQFISILSLVIIVNLFIVNKSFALLSFGGPITLITPCSNGLMIVIGPPAPGVFMLSPGTRVYAFWTIGIESLVLGNYVPSGACVIPPVIIPTMGTMTMLGTSY